MRSDFLNTLGLGACLIFGSAQATTAPTNPHNQILLSSGMISLLKIVPLEITESANQHALRCGANTVEPQLSGDSEELLSTTMRQRLASTTGIGEAGEISRWYLSAAGSKITALEKQPSTDSEIRGFIENRSNSPEWMANRYPLFKRIYENTGAGAVNAIIGVEIEYAGLIVSGCIEKYAEEHQASQVNAEQVMAGLIRSDKELMILLFKQESLFAMAFTLRSLSTAELTAYANFTELHRDYYQSLVQSFELALKHYSDNLAQQRVAVADD